MKNILTAKVISVLGDSPFIKVECEVPPEKEYLRIQYLRPSDFRKYPKIGDTVKLVYVSDHRQGGWKEWYDER